MKRSEVRLAAIRPLTDADHHGNVITTRHGTHFFCCCYGDSVFIPPCSRTPDLYLYLLVQLQHYSFAFAQTSIINCSVLF